MRAWRVTVAADDEDLATAALWEAGTAGVEVRGAPAGRVELLAYFADEAPPLALGLLPPGAAVEPAVVPDVDWVARFREGFRAFRAGRFLVAPPWDAPRRAVPGDCSSSTPGAPSGPAPTRRRGSASAPSRSWPPAGPWAARSTSARGRPCWRSRPRASAPAPVFASDIDPEATSLLPPPRAPQRRPAGGRARRRRPRPAGRLVRPRPREPDGPPARRPLGRDPLPARPRRGARPLGAARRGRPVRPRRLRGLRHARRARWTGEWAALVYEGGA